MGEIEEMWTPVLSILLMGSVVSSGHHSALQAQLGLQPNSCSSPEQTILAPKEALGASHRYLCGVQTHPIQLIV